MRDWQVGDPIGDGNDIGVPDIKYMGYLKEDKNYQSQNSSTKDIERSKQYQKEAWRLYEENKFYDALAFINAAIRYNPDDDENWNIKGIILWDILKTNDVSVGQEAYECFNMALEIKPNGNILKKNKRAFLMDWAVKLYKSLSFDQAMVRTNELLSIIEDNTSDEYVNALMLKASILMMTDNFDESMKYFDKALEIDPINITIRELKLILIKRMADYYGEDLFPYDTRY